MDAPSPPVSSAANSALRDRTLGIIATAALLAMLYFARDVLVPITLAFILSLLIAPLVRRLRRFGLNQTLSVMAAVLLLAVCFGAFATVIGSQLVRMADSLPQYEKTIRYKMETLNSVTVGRLNAFTGQAGRLLTHEPGSESQPALGFEFRPGISASHSGGTA